MRLVKVMALISKVEMKKLNYIQFGGEGLNLTLHDQQAANDMRDPKTARIVDQVYYVLWNEGVASEGPGAQFAYDQQFPPTNLVAEVPGKFVLTQDGDPVATTVPGYADPFWTINANVLLP